ncbi:MAG: SUMF1/EgtB/PvdO family nonheme iron enzyme [Ignavibacteria bacterium]|nr:SUMF1/EgtB/PvdO family nonheme iron enzyme [Ignavibacteria bacterium]
MAKTVQSYELTEKLGQGGMGVVYKARHIHFNEVYAVKMLWQQFGSDPAVLKLFLNEAKLLRSLHHPNIVNVTDIFEAEGNYYIVMEFVEGRTLSEIIQREVGPIRRDRAIKLFRQMLEGMAYIHQQNPPIIHRDLKPLNILVTKDDTVKITDFGIAKVLDIGSAASTVMKGTPTYMSPEALIDPGSVDIRTDVYSLGMTFYEMLCAKTPFSGEKTTTPAAVYSEIIKNGIPLPTKFYPGISDELTAYVMNAIHPDREKRFSDALEMLEELKRIEASGGAEERTSKNEFAGDNIKTEEESKITNIDINSENISKSENNKPSKFFRNSIIVLSVITLIILLVQLGKDGKKAEVPVEEPESTGVALDTVLKQDAPVLPGMVFVQGGTFTMGCTSEQGDDCWYNEKPTHQVIVNNFYIGKYEVTVGMFSEFIEATGYKTDADKDGGSLIWTGSELKETAGVNWRCDVNGKRRPESENNHPVIHVSWNDAVSFCNWLSDREGLQRAYSGSGDNITCNFSSNGYRLPTEAEWEYAARGGKQTKNYKYSGSDNTGAVAWYDGNSGDKTHAVGLKQPNEIGIYDMSGNVYEWCWDWKGDYTSPRQTNPKGPSSGTSRVLRGGSWGYSARNCRVAVRYYIMPGNRDSSSGFRLARTR